MNEGHTDDKYKKGEDQIRESTAIPGGMVQLSVRRFITWTVHQDHTGNRQSAKDIQRQQPPAFCHNGIFLHRNFYTKLKRMNPVFSDIVKTFQSPLNPLYQS